MINIHIVGDGKNLYAVKHYLKSTQYNSTMKFKLLVLAIMFLTQHMLENLHQH